MAYLALYREWRPRTFGEVVGQEHVVRTLVNALGSGRISHAYLFCGPRGTGKTSIAKILSRAVNCASPVEKGSPCGQCDSCRDIEAGASMDVTEIDAASNRGIDEVRDLREKIKFAPSSGRYRVFIIDEVHMLTNEAFNALLKTLEEPPGHAMFILATTEPHRVPLTILSRCQRFDFHRIGDDEMAARLREVAEGSGITVDDGAVRLIVRAAEGGMRDALGMLDQAAAYSGSLVGVEEIHRILGTVREELLDAVVKGLMAGLAGEVLDLIGEVAGQGKDLRVFARDINSRLRREMLDRMGAPRPESEEIDRLCRIIGRLAAAEQEMRWSTQPRILLEVAVVRAARIMSLGDSGTVEDMIGEMTARISELEGLVAGLGGKQVSSPAAFNVPGARPGKPEKYISPGEQGISSAPAGRKAGLPNPPDKGEIADPGIIYNVAASKKEVRPPAQSVEERPGQNPGVKNIATIFSRIDSRWNDMLETARKVYPNIATHLTQGKGWPLETDGKTLTIAFPKSGAYTPLAMGILQNEINIKELSDLIKSVCQEDLRVRLVESDKKPPAGAGRKKRSVHPDDVEALFGKAEDLPEEDFEGFDH
ncbi:MAG TPA: DNA polymerase III subunit gamma/tau [Desulfotomaculum sp.]|nr:DNA polymerase III subunit gamma/tau [Desulfotomaculum sp.]